jgi:phospholipid/cholesterol/gamma-HCH transport system substrate-binding protein
MDDRKLRLGVGVLVVASIGIAVGLTMFFGAFSNLLTKHYTITYRFDRAPGVGYDTPVKKNGVQIGRVTKLQLIDERRDPDGPTGVNVTMEIEDKHRLFVGEFPQIATGSLITGDAVVEFVRATDEDLLLAFDGQAGTPKNGRLEQEERQFAAKPLIDTDYLTYGKVKGDPFQMVLSLENDFRQTLGAVRTAGQSIDGLAVELRQVLNGDDLQLRAIAERTIQTLDEFNRTIAEVRQTVADVRGIVGDPILKQSLQDSLQRFPEVLAETQRTFQSAQRTIDTFGKAAEGVQQTADNLAKFTDPLGERSKELVDSLATSLKRFEGALAEVTTFTQKLNAGNGTIKRLIEDDELYWQIRNVIDSVETTITRVQPIVDDVRIFTDKVSRDPGQLGVRGALSGRSTGLGIK